MSRRFAYPPPCYTRNGVRGQALIESIEREKEAIKTAQRKAKKREGKEETKERKEKEKQNIRDINYGRVKQFSDKNIQVGKRKDDLIGGCPAKERDDELRDRSGLTEEHEQPTCFQSPCYLSDGSQNNNKRESETSLSGSTQKHKSVIRIKLSSTKREPIVSLSLCNEPHLKEVVHTPREEQSYSMRSETVMGIDDKQQERSGLAEEHEQPTCSQSLHYLSDGSQKKNKRKSETSLCDGTQKRRNIIRIKLSSTKEREPVVSRPLCNEPHLKEVVHTPCKERSYSMKSETAKLVESNKEVHEFDSQTKDDFGGKVAETVHGTTWYKTPVKDWVPPPFEVVLNDIDDQDWLWRPKPQTQQPIDGCKRSKAGNDVSCHASSTVWSSAQFLPEAGKYALPYVIPF